MSTMGSSEEFRKQAERLAAPEPTQAARDQLLGCARHSEALAHRIEDGADTPVPSREVQRQPMQQQQQNQNNKKGE